MTYQHTAKTAEPSTVMSEKVACAHRRTLQVKSVPQNRGDLEYRVFGLERNGTSKIRDSKNQDCSV